MRILPEKSRIRHLSMVIERRLRLYQPATEELERRLILLVAADILPSPDPPHEIDLWYAAFRRRRFD